MTQSIQPMVNRPGYFLVFSHRDPEKAYEVHARSRVCDCADWTYRQSKKAGLCRHVIAVLDHLEQLAACPQCGGAGYHIARFTGYASGSDPIRCSCCSGTGRRDNADPLLVAAADRYAAEENQRALKELFK